MYSFADSSPEVFYVDGEQFSINTITTEEFSRAIAVDGMGEVVYDFTFYKDEQKLVDNLSETIIPTSIALSQQISTPEGASTLAGDENKYIFRYSQRYDFSFADYTVAGIATAIAALVGQNYVAAFFIGYITAMVSDGLDGVYCIQDTYTYTESPYFYIKRVTNLYGSDGSHAGGPWATYQTVREK